MPQRLFASLMFGAFFLAGCGEDSAGTPDADAQAGAQTVAEIASEDDRFSTLVAALQATGLDETLTTEGPFTVFAPTNDAFDKLPAGTVEALLEDPEALAEILLYHVVPGELLATDVLASSELTTAQGALISVQPEALTLNDSVGIVATDIGASNGVIHIIDMVLLPPPPEVEEPVVPEPDVEEPDLEEPELPTLLELALSDDRFTTLVAAVEAAGLVDAIVVDGPLTIFAPTNEAFAKLPEGTVEALLADPDALANILLYHVAPGELRAADVLASETIATAQGSDITVQPDALTLNDTVNLVETDLLASNGVIHVIDMVLLPPAPEPEGSIVDILSADDQFSTLVAALQGAHFLPVFEEEGPFTLFAPTNEAFAKLPEGTIEALLADPVALRTVLRYHFVRDELLAADVLATDSIRSALGPPITVQAEDLTLNETVGIVDVDTIADNGVIHTINEVLIPTSN